MLYKREWKSPVGDLILASTDEKLCLCDWKYRKMRVNIDERILKHYKTEFTDESSTIIEQTIQQLEEYIEGRLKSFDIPIDLVGTDFQKKVWNELMKIPYGKTISYLQLAKQLGDEKVIRAAATANGANAISIIIPCHRIIGSDGELVGYAGGLTTKKKLLNLERSLIENSLF